jgi:hypothetical protein
LQSPQLRAAVPTDFGFCLDALSALRADLCSIGPCNAAHKEQERREDAQHCSTQDACDRRPSSLLGCDKTDQRAEHHTANQDFHACILNELAPLLLALGRAGIELAPHPTDAGRLRHRPADLPPDLSARLRIHRAAVLWLLVDGYAPAGDTDAGYVLGERLGVADGLGMPTRPGSAAWLVAVGESMGVTQ